MTSARETAYKLFHISDYGDDAEELYSQIDDYYYSFGFFPNREELEEIAKSLEINLDETINNIIVKTINSLEQREMCINSEMINHLVGTLGLKVPEILEILPGFYKINESVHMKRMKNQINIFIKNFYGIDPFCDADLDENKMIYSSYWTFEYVTVFEEFYAYHGRYPSDEECHNIITICELSDEYDLWIPSFAEIREFLFAAIFDLRFHFSFPEFDEFIKTNSLRRRWRLNDEEYPLFIEQMRELEYKAILKESMKRGSFKVDNDYQRIQVQTRFSPWWITEIVPVDNDSYWDVIDKNTYWKKYDLSDEKFNEEIKIIQLTDLKDGGSVYFNKLVATYLTLREMYKLDYHNYPEDDELKEYWGIDDNHFSAVKRLYLKFK